MQAILLLTVIFSSTLSYGHHTTPNYIPAYDQGTLNVRATRHQEGLQTEQGTASVYGPASPVLLPLSNSKETSVIKRNNSPTPNAALCSPPFRCVVGFNVKESYKYEKPVLKYAVPVSVDVSPRVRAAVSGTGISARFRPGVKELETLARENRGSPVFVKPGDNGDGTKLQNSVKVVPEVEQQTNGTASMQQDMDLRNRSEGSRIGHNYDIKNSEDGEAAQETTLSSLNTTRTNDSPLLESLKIMQRLLVGCREATRRPEDWEKNFDATLVRMQRCVERRILNGIDRTLDAEVVLLGSGLTLVKNNASDQLARDSNTTSGGGRAENSETIADFFETFFHKMAQLLETHSVKWDTDSEAQSQVEGRRRHQYHKAFPMMVAGYMMMSAFLVPLGFQFMAMIGGKAILLAKMALMMSTFSSFKRVNSQNEYLHHSHDYAHVPPWHHRSSAENQMTAAFYNGDGVNRTIKRKSPNTLLHKR